MGFKEESVKAQQKREGIKQENSLEFATGTVRTEKLSPQAVKFLDTRSQGKTNQELLLDAIRAKDSQAQKDIHARATAAGIKEWPQILELTSAALASARALDQKSKEAHDRWARGDMSGFRDLATLSKQLADKHGVNADSVKADGLKLSGLYAKDNEERERMYGDIRREHDSLGFSLKVITEAINFVSNIFGADRGQISRTLDFIPMKQQALEDLGKPKMEDITKNLSDKKDEEKEKISVAQELVEAKKRIEDETKKKDTEGGKFLNELIAKIAEEAKLGTEDVMRQMAIILANVAQENGNNVKSVFKDLNGRTATKVRMIIVTAAATHFDIPKQKLAV